MVSFVVMNVVMKLNIFCMVRYVLLNSILTGLISLYQMLMSLVDFPCAQVQRY